MSHKVKPGAGPDVEVYVCVWDKKEPPYNMDKFCLILCHTLLLKYSLFWGRPLQFKIIILFKTDIKNDMK